MVMNKVSMRKMEVDQAGTISTVKASCELGCRICDMGFSQDTEIKTQRRATDNFQKISR